MSKYLSIFFLFVIGFSSCKEKPEDALANAKKKYEAINKKLDDYKSKTIDDITSKAAGTITGYYREDELKKIHAEHFTDTDRVFSEYYFDDGMLVFIEQQDFVYNKPNTYTEEKAKANNDSVWYDDKKTKMEISRYYFYKNKLLKWLKPGNKEVAPATAEFIDKESVLWGETVILIKELKETKDQPPNP